MINQPPPVSPNYFPQLLTIEKYMVKTYTISSRSLKDYTYGVKPCLLRRIISMNIIILQLLSIIYYSILLSTIDPEMKCRLGDVSYLVNTKMKIFFIIGFSKTDMLPEPR